MSFSQTYFVTGFPGFIAARLVARLARPEVQFFLLVQSQFVEKAIQAVEEIAAATGTNLDNFALIEGDITLENLGIAEEDLAAIREETTDVFHLAAVYDLAVVKDLAFKVNLDGTKNVNTFARSLPNLKRYNYISTCYVAGNRTARILESELEHTAGFRNYYEETKYLAELEVEKLKTDLPVTIFRPSVVVGDSKSGETAKYDGIYYLIQYIRKAPGLLRFINVGNKNVRLNLVPVDFVVEAIAALANDANAKGKTIALADPNPLTTAELFDTLAQHLSGKASVITPPPGLVKWSLNLPFSPPITGLPHSGVPYFFIEQMYDTTVADQLLAMHGVRCPGFKVYARNLLKFVEKHPTL
ncbi:MAG TPA: SDR family oxidoreductase [Pyrinomonadaceae bacterium]|nr:SDR family oxidoreductase [Pyrinomonadaceae bacterium]